MIPTLEFGIHGLTDVQAFLGFVIFSACATLNCSYSELQPNGFLISFVALLQTVLGYLFISILIATFVQISACSHNGDSRDTDNEQGTA